MLPVWESIEEFPGLICREEFFCQVECFTYHVVHVHVPVGSKAAQEKDFSLLIRQLAVFGEKVLVIGKPLGVIGHVVDVCFLAVFNLVQGFFVVLPGREMLVLMHPGIGYRFFAVIQNRVALVITGVVVSFEEDGAVAQSAVFIVEVSIQRTGVEDMVEVVVPIAGVSCIELYLNPWCIQDPLNDLGIAVKRYALIGVVVVVVVVVETYRKALENGGWQVFRVCAPLLDSIAFEKGFVEVFPHHFQGLLFKVLRLGNAVIPQRLEKLLCLPRIEFLPEKLVDREQVDGEGEDAFVGDGFHPVGVIPEFGELPDIIPKLRLVGVENMGSIDMFHDPGFRIAFGMAVTCQVRALVDDQDVVEPFQGKLSGEHRAGEAGSHDEDFFWQRLEKFLFDAVDHILP